MNPDSTGSYDAWWVFSEGCFREMLQVLGFEIESTPGRSTCAPGEIPPAKRNASTSWPDARSDELTARTTVAGWDIFLLLGKEN